MPKFSDMTGTLSNALRLFREGGLGAVTTVARKRANRELKLFLARKIESVTFEGCSFSLKRIPNGRMKLALLRGTYEVYERHAVLQYVDPEQPVIELGGCIGVVACITNRILKKPASHVVVEANPNVIPILEENRSLNHCGFEILNAAIAYDQSLVTFYSARELFGSSRLQRGRGTAVTVGTTRLRDIVRERKFESFTLVCDIEGSEYDMVLNDADVLQLADTILIETHARYIGEAKNSQLLDKLKDLGFCVVDRDSHVLVMKRLRA